MPDTNAPQSPLPPTPPVPPKTPPPKPEDTHNPSRLGPLLGVLALIVIASALLFIKNPWFSLFPSTVPTTTPPAVVPPIQSSDVTTPSGETTATSTATTSTSEVPPTTATSTLPLYTTNTTSTHYLGETVQFFLNDDHIFLDKKDPKRSFVVTAVEFTDSRCKPGVQCIWAGEQGVKLHVTDERTNASQDVSLGMVRTRTAAALGISFNLKEIDDGKGGTYAEITVR